MSECQNYGSLNSGSRRTSYYRYNYYCDSSLGPGWFRFQGSAGTRMATSCPSYGHCGTYYPGWLSGGHPTVADGQVTRTVYFNNGYCYSYSTSIKVRNCGSYLTCTTLVVLGVDVIYVIVALTRHNCKQSLYVYILYHFIKVGFIVKTK